MISQNTKNLSIRQLQRLIDNNGVVENIDKAKQQKRPVEYCLEALTLELNKKLAKSHDKFLKSQDIITSEINSMLSSSNILPPIAPKNFKAKAIIDTIMKTEIKAESLETKKARDLDIMQAKINYAAWNKHREVLASEKLFKNSLILTASGFIALAFYLGA